MTRKIDRVKERLAFGASESLRIIDCSASKQHTAYHMSQKQISSDKALKQNLRFQSNDTAIKINVQCIKSRERSEEEAKMISKSDNIQSNPRFFVTVSLLDISHQTLAQ